MIKFEKNAAAIPQVEKTLGFYWTQTFVPDGASFADGFFNDKGVWIGTNWCGEIFDADRMEVKDSGIGYGIRRIVAERATSARHGVEIAIELLKEYGYFHDGRTYTIADANEAWQIAIHQRNSTRKFKTFAAAQSMEYKDVNKDGIMDVVFTFKANEVSQGAVPGALMDLWLYTQVNGHRVIGYDLVPVETSKVKAQTSRDGKHLL